MRIDERIGVNGIWRIQVLDKDTREIKRDEILQNHIMNASLDAMANLLIGTLTNLDIGYLALGTGDTIITNTQTTLAAEQYRTAPVSGPTHTNTAVITTEFYVTSTEANIAIEEIGIFGGTAATTAADTGTLISRILWTHTKTSDEEISFIRTDIVGRG